jgi:hypothetical protein
MRARAEAAGLIMQTGMIKVAPCARGRKPLA